MPRITGSFPGITRAIEWLRSPAVNYMEILKAYSEGTARGLFGLPRADFDD